VKRRARVDEKEGIDYYSLERCAIDPFTMIVIPAEAGIQKYGAWMPHQVRHDMPTIQSFWSPY